MLTCTKTVNNENRNKWIKKGVEKPKVTWTNN